MKSIFNEITSYIDDKKEEMVELWKEIVNLESYSREKEKVDTLGERLKMEFEKEGLECSLIHVGENNGKTLVGELNSHLSKEPIIFSGHMDTVFPSGSFGDNPFKIEDGKAYGPGVLDMKGGIIISLYVIKALNHINYKERPVKIIFSGDEEIGHKDSRGAEVITKYSKGGICAFNMETGLIDNSICIGRKGRMECHVTVNGVEAHAGNDFLSGKNAIAEMALKIIEIQKLTNLEEGITVSVGKINGGTVSNAIPSKCKIEIDIRFEKMEQMNIMEEKIKNICNKSYIEGTTTTMEIISSMAAFETTEDIMRFYDFVNKTSIKYGFGQLGHKKLGGSSDASYIGMANVPVLCSFGVQGQWNHTIREYALVDSLINRTKLISSIIINLKDFI